MLDAAATDELAARIINDVEEARQAGAPIADEEPVTAATQDAHEPAGEFFRVPTERTKRRRATPSPVVEEAMREVIVRSGPVAKYPGVYWNTIKIGRAVWNLGEADENTRVHFEWVGGDLRITRATDGTGNRVKTLNRVAITLQGQSLGNAEGRLGTEPTVFISDGELRLSRRVTKASEQQNGRKNHAAA